MLNHDMDHVVLVKGWKKSANWSFPRGKINKDEPDLECAIREVYEETGFDLKDANLAGKHEDMKYIDVTMREQQMRLYIFRGVSMDTNFEPRTRKEISKIQWYKLSELPTLKKQKQHQEGRGEDLAMNANKFYMVAPFMPPLKKWIAHQKKAEKVNGPSQPSADPAALDDNIATSKDPAFDVGNLDNSPGQDDLGGIMALLRQSNHSRPLSDLPEVLKPSISTHDASMHLKSLLRVAPDISVQAAPSPSALVSAKSNSDSLLALLQPAGQVDRKNYSPITPAKVAELLPAPQSTNPKYIDQENSSRLLPSSVSPSYPLGLQANPQLVTPHSTMPSDNLINSSQPTNQQEHLPHTRLSKQNVEKDVQSRSSHQIFPPYLRTGDPDFTRNSQMPNIHQLLGPPADNLPRPKLTTHSSALLDLFKNAGSPEPKVMDVASPKKADVGRQPDLGKPDLTVQSNGDLPQGRDTNKSSLFIHLPSELSHEPGSNKPHAIDDIGAQGHLALKTPKKIHMAEGLHPSPTQTSNPKFGPAQERSKQKDTLLHLFRNPLFEPVPSVEATKPPPTTLPPQTLEPPSLVAELSALPSPAHSREHSHVDNKAPTPGKQNMTNGSSKNSDQPSGSSRRSKPPVSATVNSPLNVPEFEVLAKTVQEAKNKPPNKHPVPPNHSPITIISRPVRARDPLSLVKKKTPVRSEEPLEVPSLARAVPGSFAPNPTTTDPKPTPYQPQILRRPTQAQASATASAGPSPLQPPLPSPKHDLVLDQRKTQSREQKHALLSLFGKPSPPISPASSKPVDIISPLSDRNLVQHTQSPTILATPNKSRLETLASVLPGDATTKRGSGRHTPRTAAVDKSFLLGYLEGVANGERR